MTTPVSTLPQTSGRPHLALFDLDHTLLPLDSDYSWGVFTTELGWTDKAEFSRRNDEFFAQYRAGTLDVHDYVRFATDAVRNNVARMVCPKAPNSAAASAARCRDSGLR